MNLLLLPGDGIGPEISRVVADVIDCLNSKLDLGIDLKEKDAGFKALESHGTTFPADVANEAETSDGIILGPSDSAAYPSPEQGGINLSAAFRRKFDLFANIRPAKSWAGIKSNAPSMDMIVVRENTEGFYADRNMFTGSGEFMPTPDLALAVRKISRDGSRRIGQVAAKIASERPRQKITIITKSNVLKLSDGLFRDECIEAAKKYSGLEVDEIHVDAAASLFVRTPDNFDVVVTSNMFGDILSNLANELSGGLGLGGSLNAGHNKAVAQASHGSAPDIADKNIANPSALLLSSGMLFDWLAERNDSNALKEAARLIRSSMEQVFSQSDNLTVDLNGSLGTKEFGMQLIKKIEEL